VLNSTLKGSNLSKTYVISANFSTNTNLNYRTDLEKSLKKFNFNNYIIFNHKNIANPNLSLKNIKIAKINPMGKIPKLFRQLFRLDFNLLIKLINLFDLNFSLMIPHNLRLFYTKELLLNLNDNDFVFLVDSRDLIFQINPNQLSSKLANLADLHFFDERYFGFKSKQIQLIQNSPANKYWLKLLDNNDLTLNESYHNKFIINSGCMAGKVYAMRDFINKAVELIQKNPYKFHEILDQAVVNKLVYQDFYSSNGILIHQNGEFVLNMCGVIQNEVKIQNGKIMSEKGVIPIVHQYDRFTNFTEDSGITLRKSPYEYQNLGKIL
jgi:hypothetical protein